MVRPFKKDIDFLSRRRIFFIVSLLLVLVSLAALPLRGLNFGIDFVGGTSIAFSNTGEVSTEQMRDAVEAAGAEAPVVQSTRDAAGTSGYIVRVPITEAAEASTLADGVVGQLGLSDNSAEVTTIGAAWGDEVTRTSLIAFAVALALIIIYIAIRFEYKMGVVAVVALLHDLLVIVGIYSLFGREITPNVIAALLTIMGYSLYDTVVVFHRINDNMSTTAHHSFLTVANHSINQVFIRTLNTTLTSLVPVVAMLFFGGETLKDFAFAMTIGLVLGAYSSIGIASPLYALWKQREPKFKKLYEKYGEGVGTFTTAENLQD
jgi:SecD/SecF fusion protein